MIENGIILEAEKISKRFKIASTAVAPSGLLTAVDGVNLSIRKGETIGIAGESGCGKSTFGKLLSGLLPADNGEIRYHGKKLDALSVAEKKIFRRKTQMIFQDPFSALNPRMRVGDAISEPLLIAGNSSRSLLRAETLKLLDMVGLQAEHASRFPDEFSGGQRQRIGIARALASSPELLIADEPVSSLDISIQAQIINLLQSMKNEHKLTMVMISHDLSVLRHTSDRIMIMYLGTIVEDSPASEIFDNYLHPYTEALIAAIPGIRKIKERKIPLLNDDVPSPLMLPMGCRFHPRCRYTVDICRMESPRLEEKKKSCFTACHLVDKIS